MNQAKRSLLGVLVSLSDEPVARIHWECQLLVPPKVIDKHLGTTRACMVMSSYADVPLNPRQQKPRGDSLTHLKDTHLSRHFSVSESPRGFCSHEKIGTYCTWDT